MANEYLNNKAFEAIINQFQEATRLRNQYHLMNNDLQEANKRKAKHKSNTKADVEALTEMRAKYDAALAQWIECQKMLATAFYTLSENIVRYAKFSLIDADDAIQEGVLICFEKVDRFDPTKGKAFNYMTTCILNSFRQIYRSMRNYNELKKKYLRHMTYTTSKKSIK